MDELDEFNEAPHSLRSESSFHEMPHDDMERINLDDDDDDDDDRNQINILDRTVPGRISSTDLLSDDITTTTIASAAATTTTIQADNLMLDIDTPHLPFNSNGNVQNNVHSHSSSTGGGGGGGGGGATILENRYTSSSNHSKSDKIANSRNGSAIGDVLILTNKSNKPQQHFKTHSRNA